MKKTVLAFIFIIIFISCEKKNKKIDFKVEGIVMELGTDVPIPNTKVAIYFNSESGEILEYETLSNNEGKYSLSGELIEDDEYLIKAENDQYFSLKDYVFPIGIYGYKNIYLAPPAWAGLHIKNVTKEFIGIRILHKDATPNPEIYNSAEILKYVIWGLDTDTNIVIKQPGNMESTFNYCAYFSQTGCYIRTFFNLNCPGRDTAYYTLEY